MMMQQNNLFFFSPSVYKAQLHSHKVNYGSGSGQQSVTGFADSEADANSYWLVQAMKADHSAAKPHGTPIKRGDIVILRHMATGNWLHSHHHSSPLSGQQEVSAYSGKDEGNFFEVLPKGSESWERGKPLRLRHISTDKFLGMSANR